MKDASKRVVVVLGPHRSGTSAITKGLETLGVSLGTDLIGAKRSNEKGHWEDVDFQGLNKEMLAAVGREWHHLKPLNHQEIDFLRQKFSGFAGRLLKDKVRPSQPFGVKDPRFSLLLGFWKPAFREAGLAASYVLALRSPMSVAASLQDRDKLPSEKGYWIWILYLLEALRGTEGLPRIVVGYHELLKDPGTECRRMAAELGLELNQARLEGYGRTFLDSSLNHFNSLDAIADDGTACPRLAADMFRIVHQVAVRRSPGFGESFSRELDRWRLAFSDVHSLLCLSQRGDSDFAQMKTLAVRRKEMIEELRAGIAAREREIATLQNTVKAAEESLADLQVGRVVLEHSLESVEIWQRSWFRRAFTRWHRFPKKP